MMSTQDRELVELYGKALWNPGTSIAYCYCSIFDACWVVDSKIDLYSPEPVDACPDFGAEAFGN